MNPVRDQSVCLTVIIYLITMVEKFYKLIITDGNASSGRVSYL